MGVPAGKATYAARGAETELKYVLETLQACEYDIYAEGLDALDECLRLLAEIARVRAKVYGRGGGERP